MKKELTMGYKMAAKSKKNLNGVELSLNKEGN